MARAFRVGVDAINLSADRRGMGRIVRAVLAYLGGARDVEVTLLARTGKARRALAREFPGTAVAGVREAWRHDRFDAVWYPWNGIRFPARAPGLLLVCDPFAFTYPHPDAVARWREQKPIRRGLQHAARIATISAWTRDELVGLFGLDETEIDVIPLAPDPSFVPGLGDPDPHALTGGKPFVLAVGLGDARKNGALLVEAFAGAFPDRDVTLVVAGSSTPTPSARKRSGTSTCCGSNPKTRCCGRCTATPTRSRSRRWPRGSAWWPSRRWRAARR